MAKLRESAAGVRKKPRVRNNAMSNWQPAAIALGGNLGDPPATLSRAVERLNEHSAIHVLAVSELYRSEAIGPSGQPDYANAVVSIVTALAPEVLLTALQAIENEAGRERHVRWGARTLDLDLLLYDDLVQTSLRLSIPHIEMVNRAFVLVPLSDIMPALIFPSGQTLHDALAALDNPSLLPWPDTRWQLMQRRINAGLT